MLRMFFKKRHKPTNNYLSMVKCMSLLRFLHQHFQVPTVISINILLIVSVVTRSKKSRELWT